LAGHGANEALAARARRERTPRERQRRVGPGNGGEVEQRAGRRGNGQGPVSDALPDPRGARTGQRRRRRALRAVGKARAGPVRGGGTYFFPSTAPFTLFASRNLPTRFAGILIGSPVCGLRPIRALRFASTSFPKPGSTKPFFASLVASARVSSNTSA